MERRKVHVNFVSPVRRLVARSWPVVLWCCLPWVPAAYAQDVIACPVIRGDPSPARNEVGVNVLGLLHFGYDPLYPRPEEPRASFVNGVLFKRRYSRNAVRVSVDVYRDSFEARRGMGTNPGYYSATGSAVRTEIRSGFERQFTSGRIQPHAAIDLMAGHERTRLEGEGWGDLAWQQGPEHGSMRYGIALSIGLSWRFSSRFSCSAEGGAWFILIEDGSGQAGDRAMVYDVLRSFSLNYHWF